MVRWEVSCYRCYCRYYCCYYRYYYYCYSSHQLKLGRVAAPHRVHIAPPDGAQLAVLVEIGLGLG